MVIFMIYCVGVICLLLVLIIYRCSGNFFKSFLTSALGGVGALCAVSVVSSFVPLGVGLNLYSLVFSVFYSIPGVIFLLVSEAFLKM